MRLNQVEWSISKHSRLRLSYYSQHTVESLQSLGHTQPTLTALSMLMEKAEEGFLNRTQGSYLAQWDWRDEWLQTSLFQSYPVGSLYIISIEPNDVPSYSVTVLLAFNSVRLALSLTLQAPPHLLVLDEISTHLDFHTVTALVGALSDYEGAILLVSHDRSLIRGVISGESPIPHGDSGNKASDYGEDDRKLSRRNVVYELKGGKLIERDRGVKGFEESSEAGVKKMVV